MLWYCHRGTSQGLRPTHRRDFLKEGGEVTTPLAQDNNGTPNGWAPLQWMTYLVNTKLGKQHCSTMDYASNQCISTYRETTRKYNVEDMSLLSGGGEYEVQDDWVDQWGHPCFYSGIKRGSIVYSLPNGCDSLPERSSIL